ncbi:MAG: SDR family oxidoreductase [Gammaproteobacteria bacterium]|nr:SDR family oxidoreductase [Gammaproteobacteria bacterium]MBQ0840051.1 SDR family oxidoreductase [Gammaproteobacteria bacterium]
MKFDSWVVMVTGAASGIGLGTAKRFIADGATVLAVDINQDNLATAASELGSQYVPLVCDICKVAEIKALMEKVEKDYGRLDTLVNNAAFANFQSPENVEEESYDAEMTILIKAPIFLVKHGAKLLRAAPNGSVINIASAAAIVSIDNYCPYGVGKAAVLKFTQDSVISVPGIRHNVILPGLIDTPILPNVYGEEASKMLKEEFPKMLPCKRVGQPDDIAKAVCFLASDDASYVNGTSMLVDGGMSKLNPFSVMQS